MMLKLIHKLYKPSSSFSIIRNFSSFPAFPSHPKFHLLKSSEITDYGISVGLYSHKQTGGQLLSVQANDDNKVFGITFRTPPNDSTGLPHILEHSVLCGSRKYKSKEPFADLLKGSLNTFLNAFTYPDRTCYPVASINTKDFYNLVDVYLDAVFYPRAIRDPKVLQQEGWHYEYNQETKELSYKGVVYNEMKGVYSSPSALMDRVAQQALFPDNTYHVDSGGDPTVIPSLTFEQFVDFHSKTYNPSNSRAYFYGNDDLTKRLDILDSYFSGFQNVTTTHTQIPLQRQRNLLQSHPNKIEVNYPSSGGEDPDKRMFSMNWLLNEEFLTPKERMKLDLLNHLLIGTPASDLYKILIDSQLGESFLGHLSDELQQSTYSLGMKGVHYENITKLETLISNSLLQLSQNGFSEDAIASSLNTMEFDIREFNTGGYPKGLSFMLEALNHWIYDQDPINALQFEQSLHEIKEEIKGNKHFFSNLIEKYLLNNSHCIKIVMKPDLNLEEKMNQEERERMIQLRDQMTTNELEKIILTAEELKQAQEAEDTPEAKLTIPRLTLDDLDRDIKEIPVKISQLSYSQERINKSITLLEHNLPSSGILYSEIGFDFSRIPLKDIPLLSLFSNLMTDSGTKTMDEVALSRYIGTMTGGVSVSLYTDLKNKPNAISDPNEVLLYWMIGSKCTADRIPKMFEILYDLLINSRLDNQKKTLELLLQTRSRRVNSVTSSGHRYASTKLLSQVSFLGYFNENTGGLTYLQSLDELIEQVTNNWEDVTQRLENIRHVLLNNIHINRNHDNKDNIVINLTGDQHLLDAANQPLRDLFGKLENFPSMNNHRLCHSNSVIEEWKSTVYSNKSTKDVREGIAVSSQVNYVIKGGSIYQPGENIKGSTAVVARFLSSGYLWNLVRVIGGAYGGSGSFSSTSGRFVFSSYRDPNLVSTLENYDGSSDYLLNTTENLTNEDITQSIIATVGDMDSPLFVDQKGQVSLRRYLRNESHLERIQWRNEIIQTSVEDFSSFGQRLKILKENGGIVIVGSKSALEAANEQLKSQGKQELLIQPAFVTVKNENGEGEGESEGEGEGEEGMNQELESDSEGQ